ncbi:MAG: hypothetical protein A4E53_00360 [Pelotomaculum sp. PtaB.Bin104]|nr:MAG: hypothetical protein A4E53_00360 [Pelotomaculum sp. PtaB.Bin104]
MRRFLIGLLVGLLIATTSIAYADNPIKLIVNGQEIYSDVPPQIVNDRVMVPVRFVSEALGAGVVWSDNSVYIASQEISKFPVTEREVYNTELPRITGPENFNEIIRESLLLIRQKDIGVYSWIVSNINEIVYESNPSEANINSGAHINTATKVCSVVAKEFDPIAKEYPKNEVIKIYLGILAHEAAHVYYAEAGFDNILSSNDKEAICNLVGLRTIIKAGGSDSDLSVRLFKKIVNDNLKL